VGGVSILLTAPVIGPIFKEYGQMIRYATPFPAVVGYAKLPFEAFTADQMSLSDFLGIIYPLKEVKEVGSQFIGLFALMLCCFGLFPKRWRRHAIFFALLAAYSLLSAAGSNLGLAYINYHIPLLNMVREPTKFLFLFSLGSSVLAAIGFDHLRLRASNITVRIFTKREFIAAAVVAAACVSALNFSRCHLASSGSTAFTSAACASLLIGIGIFGGICFRKSIRCVLVLLLAGATLFFNALLIEWTAPSIVSGFYLSDESLHLHSVFRKIAQIDPNHNYRVLIDGALEKQRAAMIGSFYGVRTFNVYGNPLPFANMNEVYYFQPRGDKYLQAMGAKYLICDKCSAEAVKQYRFREQIEGINIFETEDAAPYYCLKSRIDGTYNDLNEYAVQTASFSLKRGILTANILDVSRMGLSRDSSEQPSGCTVLQEERSPNKLSVALNCPASHVFVLNEFYGGQWTARINGKRVWVARVNGNQVGVPVGSGGSYLEIEYAPESLRLSFYPFLAGLTIFGCLIFAEIRKNKQPVFETLGLTDQSPPLIIKSMSFFFGSSNANRPVYFL
jgi:hypothetical protein